MFKQAVPVTTSKGFAKRFTKGFIKGFIKGLLEYRDG